MRSYHDGKNPYVCMCIHNMTCSFILPSLATRFQNFWGCFPVFCPGTDLHAPLLLKNTNWIANILLFELNHFKNIKMWVGNLVLAYHQHVNILHCTYHLLQFTFLTRILHCSRQCIWILWTIWSANIQLLSCSTYGTVWVSNFHSLIST